MQHPPKSLQATLWSVDINSLDIDKDKSYIVHQILSYGGMEEWQWLYKTYPEKVITNVFTTQPFKDYREPRFLFVKNFLLHLEKTQLDERNYVKNTPRHIR